MDKKAFSIGLLSGIICFADILEKLPEDQIQEAISKFKQASAVQLEKTTGTPGEDVLTRMGPIVDKAMENMKNGW